MEGAQLKFDLTKLRATINDDGELRNIITAELKNLAERYDMDVKYVADFSDEVFDKVRAETRKFRSDRKEPYPLPHVNNLSVQIVMPVLGKVGVTEWNSAVRV